MKGNNLNITPSQGMKINREMPEIRNFQFGLSHILER